MNANAIQLYVKKQKSWGSLQSALLGVLAILGGLLALFLTFWLAYGMVWLGTIGVSSASQIIAGKPLSLTHEKRLVCAGLFIVLLFIEHLKTDPSYWSDYPDEDYDVVYPFYAMSLDLFPLLMHPNASGKMIVDFLRTGPRLVIGSWKLFRRAKRLRGLDETSCATLLTFLVGQHHSVSYEDLKNAGWGDWLGQLRTFEGVLFMEKGLMLTPDLRKDLGNPEPYDS